MENTIMARKMNDKNLWRLLNELEIMANMYPFYEKQGPLPHIVEDLMKVDFGRIENSITGKARELEGYAREKYPWYYQ